MRRRPNTSESPVFCSFSGDLLFLLQEPPVWDCQLQILYACQLGCANEQIFILAGCKNLQCLETVWTSMFPPSDALHVPLIVKNLIDNALFTFDQFNMPR